MADNLQVNKLTAEVRTLNEEISKSQRLLGNYGSLSSKVKGSLDVIQNSFKNTGSSIKSANTQATSSGSGSSGNSLPKPSTINTVFTNAKNYGSAAMAGYRAYSSDAGSSAPQASAAAPRAASFTGGGNPSSADRGLISTGMSAGSSMLGGIGGGAGGGTNLLSGAIGLAQKASDVYGSIAAGGLQYAYNRIEGNRGTSLAMAQALAPNAGMMGMKVSDLFTGLAQRAPVLGSNADIISTILAGQGVGAFMSGKNASPSSGIPGRNGFFESVRQMQLLTPGVGAGQLAGTVSNYIGNTKSQQTGMFLGQGAFTMIGQGGRYKSLAEWADAILKFLSQQRPGKTQGQTFGKDELMAQNFPGSNINAWFQMMGVPPDMVNYWWQYALANAGQSSPVTDELSKSLGQSGVLAQNIKNTRGLDLGFEHLRSTTQATRRDYLMGTQMYGLYNAREAADRRFNVAMQGADLTIGNLARTTNAGLAMATAPTDIAAMLMPIMTKLASSPIGVAGSLLGNVMSLFGGGADDPGDVPMGDVAGSYTSYGSTSTAHMSPDLGKKVGEMMRANPRLKISSGYRDTVTQNRLHKNGVGRVGPASKSAHTRGWAADIGPRSELGWVQANASKFGLQTGSHAGEPWHVQLAGTMPIGDPDDIPSPFNPFGGLGGGSGGLFDNLLTTFITGGTMSSLIDNLIKMFIKTMTAPLAGLMHLFGPASVSEEDITNLVNKPSSVKIDISKYAGFTPKTNSAITSKDSAPILGDPISAMMSQSPTINAKMDSPIIFKTEIHIGGSSGNSPIDAQKTASTIADHLEDEFSRRQWRKY